MIPIIVLKIQYQVIYNQSNLSFQTYFEEFIYYDTKLSTLHKERIHNMYMYMYVYIMYKVYFSKTFQKQKMFVILFTL